MTELTEGLAPVPNGPHGRAAEEAVLEEDDLSVPGPVARAGHPVHGEDVAVRGDHPVLLPLQLLLVYQKW